MMHFLEFICVKMHDFCVNAIPEMVSQIVFLSSWKLLEIKFLEQVIY